MRFDFGVVLLWGVPGLVVLTVGWSVVFARRFRGRGLSRLGLRLRAIGFGLFDLGLLFAGECYAIAAGAWWQAVLFAAICGWQPVLFFWQATRSRVVANESQAESR